MDLFETHGSEISKKNAPLADRMRPRTLSEYIGQTHIIGEGRLLRRAIQIDQLSSLIFYGPPGTGKTTLARIIANTTKASFLSINAVLSGVKEIRESIKIAETNRTHYLKKTILFIDEVHRFNKAQQDALLPHVENGTIILIGATTENPFFEVNKALVSRSRIFQLKSLTEEELKETAIQAINDKERGYGNHSITLDKDAISHLVKTANGDARAVLNALELAVETTTVNQDNIIHLTRSVIEESIQRRAVLYDKDGDVHYDTISAFIKSIRGSDPDAALYWMAKMLYAGEDPKFIFRRMVILASEDIGLADPQALSVVMSAAQAYDFIGMPEGRFPLAQACLYLSTAPKSNTTLAFFDALQSVAQEKDDEVPNHLKDGSRDKEEFGHGKGYLYPHAYRDHWVAQQYLPNVLQGKTFYEPSNQGYEEKIQVEVTRRREAHIEAMVENSSNIYGSEMFPHEQSISTQWERRSGGQQGEQITLIRDTIMKLAQVQRDSFVLDCNGKTGFLTFEAARIAREGGVWSLSHDNKSYETLMMMSQKLQPFERPEIIQGSPLSLPDPVIQHYKKELFFDSIIGHNLFSTIPDHSALISALLKTLSSTGTIVLGEIAHRESSRLSHCIKDTSSSYFDILKQAEELFFISPINDFVNWTEGDIKATLSSQDVTFKTTAIQDTYSRTFSPYEISQWVHPTESNKKRSLGCFLNDLIPNNLKEFEHYLMKELCTQEHQWSQKIIFVTISPNSSAQM